MKTHKENLIMRSRRPSKATLIAFALPLAMLASGPTEAQSSFLDRINNGLQKTNEKLSTVTGVPAPAQSGASARLHLDATPTEAQIERMASAMSAVGKPDDVEPMYLESRELISELLLIASCNFSAPRAQMARHLAPEGQSLNFTATAAVMQYHPKSQCLDVQRLDAWTSVALNAFRFRAQFVSEQSGESAQRFFTLAKQPDGVWMLVSASNF